MHDSHVLEEDTGKGSVALRVHWTECTDLCFASSLKSVQFRKGRVEIYIPVQKPLLHRYIQGRDSGRLLWWTDVRIAALTS